MNQCLGIYGNDTAASAQASADAVVTISFDPSFRRPGDYALDVSYRGDKPNLALTDKLGQSIGIAAGSPVTLHAAPGDLYYLSVSLPASSTNSGGCCEDKKQVATTLDVRLTKAPILASAYLSGYVRGGNQTTAYKNVGAILLDGAVHCTGTVIGKYTVLTAAHCLYGFDTSHMTFVLGPNYQFPEKNGGPFHVDSPSIPDGKGTPFSFNPRTLEDDIALIYLVEPVQVAPAQLHQQKPSWDAIAGQHTSLVFVGYGFNVIGDEKVGIGIKREGVWPIDSVSNLTFAFAVTGLNTCYGDSGGPAFIESAQLLLVAGVTSRGDEKCTQGIDTRVDAYGSWLTAKIR